MRARLSHHWSRILIGCLALTTFSAHSAAEDWPQWRGKNRDNVSTESDLLDAWPEAGPPLKWRAKGLGYGVSPVSAANGRVFTVCQYGSIEYVRVLDEATGHHLWTVPLGPAIPQSSMMRWLTQRPPTVDGDRLYAVSLLGELACIDIASENERWRRNYIDEFDGIRPLYGFSDCPVATGQQLICTPGGDRKSVVALDQDTGQVRWSCDVQGGGRAAYSNGVVAEISGVRQFIAFLEHSLVGVAVADGELLWRIDGAVDRYHHPGTPIVRGQQVFCLNAFKGETKLLNLHLKNDAFVVREVYSKPIRHMNRYSDDAVIVGDHLFAIGSGIACCIQWRSGEVIYAKRVGKQCRSTYADGHLYTHEPGGSIRRVAVTGTEIESQFEFQLPGHERSLGPTTPVIANKCLFVRDDDQLLAFDLAANSESRQAAPIVDLPPVGSVSVSLDASASSQRFKQDTVFVPTPRDVVDRMLQLANVTPEDTVVDLGSGDGRIIIAAARKFGAKSIGYEIDSKLADLAERAIQEAGLEGKASVIRRDLFEADLSDVDVILMYVLPGMMRRLMPKIRELPDGVRIVSHEGRFSRRIQPNKTVQMRSTEDEIEHRIHLYVTPLPESTSRSAR